MENKRQEKELKRFKNRFSLYTEGVSYFIIIPIAVLYVWFNLNLTYEQVILMLKCAAAAVILSLPITIISDNLAISPVLKYFKKCLSGQTVSEDEYVKAQKRFFSLPYIHSVGSFFRWIYGLSMAVFPFIYFSDLSYIQKSNLIMLFFVIPPLCGILFFFLTELYIQKLLNIGIFNRIALKKFNLKFNLISRIFITVVVMVSIPVLGVIGYFSIIIDTIDPDYKFSYLRLGGILLFGLLVAITLIIPLLKTIKSKLNIIIGFLEKVGSGDLGTEKRIIAVIDDLTSINQTVYIMKKNIMEIIYEISDISKRLDTSAHEISSITGDFTDDTQNQAATVEEVTSTIEEISSGMDIVSARAQGQVESLQSLIAKMNELTTNIKEMEQKVSNTISLTDEITTQARHGEEALQKMDESMGKISGSSKEMTGIINIINDISDKINLLSLNAAIEAARAGDAGKGFAVVADEISKLADSTAVSVKNIDSLIKASEKEIVTGISIVAEVVDLISSIMTSITSMNMMMESISEFMNRQIETNSEVDQKVITVRTMSEEIEVATQEQKVAISEVVIAINRINELTQSISSGSEEIAANTSQNAAMADILKGKVDMFKLA